MVAVIYAASRAAVHQRPAVSSAYPWKPIGTLRAFSTDMVILALMVGMLFLTLLTLPTWPYSEKWGYLPTSACGAGVVAILALVLVGRI